MAILNDQSIVGYLATVDGGKPRVRPWGFIFEEDGRASIADFSANPPRMFEF